MTGTPRRCFVHVGLPKTGTSYLQSVFRGSTDELSRQGVAFLPTAVEPATRLMKAVRDRLDERTQATVLGRHRDRLAAAADVPTVLTSQEQLSPATPEQAARLFALTDDRELHLVVTARTVARQIPSGWQERIKTRSVHPYETFVQAVMARRPLAADFWRHQDLPDVLRRWGATLPPARVHVVTVPPPGAPRELLLQRFCGLLGVDPASLPTDSVTPNTSFGMAEAEMLRRVNVSLGGRLRQPWYAKVIRRYLIPNVLRPQIDLARAAGVSAPPLLPTSTQDWCRQLTDEWIACLQEAGYDIVGDLDDLHAPPSAFGADDQAASDDEVARVTVDTLAAVLALRGERLAEAAGVATAPSAPPAPTEQTGQPAQPRQPEAPSGPGVSGTPSA